LYACKDSWHKKNAKASMQKEEVILAPKNAKASMQKEEVILAQMQKLQCKKRR